MLARIHGHAPRDAVLEVGCGPGAYVDALSGLGAHPAFGMDPSRGMLERTRARGRVAYLRGDAARLPFADRSLAMIFSVNVIHHVADVRAYLREAFRVLVPGGIVCTATDSEAIIRRRDPLSRYWPATIAPELERYHRIERLHEEMSAAAFDRIETREAGARITIDDAAPYRDKAYSCLELITQAEFRRGLDAIERDLRNGPLEGRSELVFVSGVRV